MWRQFNHDRYMKGLEMKVSNSVKKQQLLVVFFWFVAISNLNFINAATVGGTSYTFETFSYPNAWITSPFGMNDLGMQVGMYFPKIGVHKHHGYLYDSSIFTSATDLWAN